MKTQNLTETMDEDAIDFDPYIEDPLLTPEQAAEYCKVSVSTINQWRREKRLPVVRVTADVRFRRSDLNKFINAHLTWGWMEGPEK